MQVLVSKLYECIAYYHLFEISVAICFGYFEYVA